MKIKKLYKANNLPMRYVVQKCNGEYASFLCAPFREVKEDELKKMPFFTPVGNNAEEAEEYMYKFYGFEKELEFKTILEKSGMNMKQFSEYFGIPYRTVQGWKAGNRECPDYLLKLIVYKLEKERQEKKMTNIEVLMMDGCTQSEAEKHLKNGSIVFEESDLKEHFDGYMTEWDIDEEDRKLYEDMIATGKPATDWGVVDTPKGRFFIMYCL